MELFSNPFSELIFPSLIFKSSLKYLPNGYPATMTSWRFFGSFFEKDINALGLRSTFNKARSSVLSVEIKFVSYSLLK